MRRLFSTRHGFFALAAVVCWTTLLVIEREFRWVALGTGCVYLLLSVLFWAEDMTRANVRTRSPKTARMSDAPLVLFVCTQNAGRSQMAEALFNRAANGRAVGRSAGTQPAAEPHPVVLTAIAEIGIDTAGLHPKALTDSLMNGVDLVVTMGCGDECPVIPGARVLDWDLPDPAGRPIEAVREIRDDIETRVTALLDALFVA